MEETPKSIMKSRNLEMIAVEFLFEYCANKEMFPPIYVLSDKNHGLYFCQLKVDETRAEGYGKTRNAAKVAATVNYFRMSPPSMTSAYFSFRLDRLLALNLDPVQFECDELTRSPLYPGCKQLEEAPTGSTSSEDTDEEENASLAFINSRRPFNMYKVRSDLSRSWNSSDESVGNVETASCGTATTVRAASIGTQTEEGPSAARLAAQPVPRTPPPSPADLPVRQRVHFEIAEEDESGNAFAKFWKSLNCFRKRSD